MDNSSFDRLARGLAAGASRRALLRVIGGGAGLSGLALLGVRARPGVAQDDPRAQAECPSETWACGDACVAACPAGWVADPATCSCSCEPGRTDCGGVCVDLATDSTNCGACGVACAGANATLACVAGACTIQGCAAGYADCDGDVSNGCETALGTLEHCLSCGDRCPDTGGACTEPACAPGVGCTTANASDGTPCGSSGTCTSGVCLECGAGGACQGDAECCAGEVCCAGTCRSAASFADDQQNCGACGNTCPSETCHMAVCAGGTCGSEPVPDDTVCGESSWCKNGACVDQSSGNSVTSLTLINADTDQPIGPLVDGAILNLATLPTRNLNVRANTNPATVGSVRFGYDANPNFRTENTAPYAFAGDNAGNYDPWTPSKGQHTITATCYEQRNASGKAGSTLTVRFTVTEENEDEPQSTGPKVTGLTLVNADTNKDIGPLAAGDTLNLATLPTRNLNVRANTDPAIVGSVRFGLDASSTFSVENGAPYALAGDNGGDYNPWTPTLGAHTIAATAYPQANAGGTAGPTLTVAFTVTDDEDEEVVVDFSDDFESGNMSKWTSVTGVAVQTTEFASGRFAARATANGSASFARHKLTNATDALFARVRFKILSQGSNPVFLLRARTGSGTPLVGLQVDTASRLALVNNVGGTTSTSSTTVSANEWHEVQIRLLVDGSKSETEVWYDDGRVASLSGTTSLGTADIAELQIGDDTINRRFDIVFDDAAASNERIPTLPKPSTGSGGGGVSTAPGANQSVLMATYTFRSSRGGGVDWSRVSYRPRQFANGFTFADPSWGPQRVDDAGDYSGWDVFPTYNWSVHRVESRGDWCVLEVNRPVTLAVLWRGGAQVPNWLGGWTKGKDVKLNGKSFPTYRRSFSAGQVALGGVYDPGQNASVARDTYWVLLAESDGKPSPAPAVPGGRQAPQPNQTCPAWVHDQYTAVGPDGNVYRTWHHLIDPVYWCYHRHEHGSNPAAFASNHKPLYGYAAAKHGMEEPHAGFKTMVMDDASGNRWMVTIHMGTAGLGRVCLRFHTVGIAVRNIASGELLADLHWMGDTGQAALITTQAHITPAACPNQAAEALSAGSRGIRQIPSQADGAINYEPWRIDDPRTVLGITGTFTVNNPDVVVRCDNSNCNQAVATGQSGSKRFFTANDGFGIVAGANSGTFYTDPYAMRVVSANEPGAIRQYVKPGVKLSFPPGGGTAGHCFDVHAWGKMFACGVADAPPTDREGSIQPPN